MDGSKTLVHVSVPSEPQQVPITIAPSTRTTSTMVLRSVPSEAQQIPITMAQMQAKVGSNEFIYYDSFTDEPVMNYEQDAMKQFIRFPGAGGDQHAYILNDTLISGDPNLNVGNFSNVLDATTSGNIITDQENISSDIVQEAQSDQENVIDVNELFGWMKNISNQIVDLKSGLQTLLKQAPVAANNGRCDQCLHCNPELMEQSKNMPFEKIKGQQDLEELEAKLENDGEFKSKFINFCHNIIGAERHPNKT